MTTTQYLFSFSGRIGRGRWWFGQLLVVIAMLAAFASEIALLRMAPALSKEYLTTIFDLVGMVVLLAISVKRSHDLGKSGWFLLNLFKAANELALLQGEEGPNKFGADPQQKSVESYRTKWSPDDLT
jgi:uncharacterized membrane protein YhaH (DUF805 family)